MKEKIRFHLDESVSNAIAAGLIRREIDVTTTPEVGLIAASDLEQLSFASSQNLQDGSNSTRAQFISTPNQRLRCEPSC